MKFNNIQEFLEYLLNFAEGHNDIEIGCTYSQAVEIVEGLIRDYYSLAIVDLTCDEREYDKEYIVSIIDGEVSVERAYVNNGYLLWGYDNVFALSGCTEDFINRADVVNLVNVSLPVDCEDESINVRYNDYGETIIEVLEENERKSFVTSKELSKEDLDRIAKFLKEV